MSHQGRSANGQHHVANLQEVALDSDQVEAQEVSPYLGQHLLGEAGRRL